MSERARFLVALLLEGRVATEIDGLRRALGSRDLERIAPHVTLVPPTNLPDGQAPAAERAVAAAAAASVPFELRLGPVATFPGNRRVLFLGVGAGEELTVLREHLVDGPFAERGSDRPFVPHVTLVSRREPFVERALLEMLSGYGQTVRVDRVSLLVQQEHVASNPWSLVTSFDLGPAPVIGRGGREVRLVSGEQLSPRIAALAAEWAGGMALEDRGAWRERFCLAVLDEEVVAVATWSASPDEVALTRLVVDPLRRGEGIGAQLLDRVEFLAQREGAASIQVPLPPGSELERYLVGRGYLVGEQSSGAPATGVRVLVRHLI